MKALLVASAALEGATGVALLVHPSGVVSLLLGAGPETAATEVVSRMAGAALVSLATACWLASQDRAGGSAAGLVAALLLYNTLAAGLLAVVAVADGLRGPVTWPVVVLHTAMAVWCVACLRLARRARR